MAHIGIEEDLVIWVIQNQGFPNRVPTLPGIPTRSFSLNLNASSPKSLRFILKHEPQEGMVAFLLSTSALIRAFRESSPGTPPALRKKLARPVVKGSEALKCGVFRLSVLRIVMMVSSTYHVFGHLDPYGVR